MDTVLESLGLLGVFHTKNLLLPKHLSFYWTANPSQDLSKRTLLIASSHALGDQSSLHNPKGPHDNSLPKLLGGITSDDQVTTHPIETTLWLLVYDYAPNLMRRLAQSHSHTAR